jgi:uncharacterized protein (DUF58 family)
MGIFIFLIAILAIILGSIRNELTLSLVGVVFLTVLLYSFLAVLITALIHRKKNASISVRIVPKQTRAGKTGDVIFSYLEGTKLTAQGKKPAFIRLPGILIRYQIRLQTRDKRQIVHIFDPDFLVDNISSFRAERRGAYYSAYDELMVLDALGFFKAGFRIPQDNTPRLLVSPNVAANNIPIAALYGGAEQRQDTHYIKTDELIDHRPYIPGDDPRRINWKLYGHAGDLFVREGEPEPPPHSRLLILIDTQADRILFTREAARQAVDKLCENAMAVVLDYLEQGMSIFIGYTGGKIQGGNKGELAAALAYPATLPLIGAEELPLSPEDRGILILALPRSDTASAALDRYLKKRPSMQMTEILFLYHNEALHNQAEANARLYRQYHHVNAQSIALTDENRYNSDLVTYI